MYITVHNIQSAMTERTLVELTNDDFNGTSVVESVVIESITYACELVDGYLHGRYILPLTAIPTIIHNICIALAKHWLYNRRAESELPKAVINGRKEAISDLEAIQDGRIHLGIKGVPELQKEPGEFKVKASSKIDLSGY